MMRLTPRAFVAAVATCLAVFGTAGAARAQSFRHLDRLAIQLERQAGELHEEVHAHFRNSPQYRHLDQDVRKMQELARHIHATIDRRGGAAHVARDVNELDRTYRHTNGLVREMARFRDLDRQAYRHLQTELNRLGETVRHMREDLNQVQYHNDRHGPYRYGPYDYYRR